MRESVSEVCRRGGIEMEVLTLDLQLRMFEEGGRCMEEDVCRKVKDEEGEERSLLKRWRSWLALIDAKDPWELLMRVRGRQPAKSNMRVWKRNLCRSPNEELFRPPIWMGMRMRNILY